MVFDGQIDGWTEPMEKRWLLTGKAGNKIWRTEYCDFDFTSLSPKRFWLWEWYLNEECF